MGDKPKDPLRVAEYDVVKIVWRDPNESAPPNSTATVIQSFGVYIEKLYQKVKELKKDIKTAKEKRSKKLDSLEAEHNTQVNLICAAIEAVVKYADRSVLENMGGNHKLAVILWNVFRTAAMKDVNGPWSRAVLSLMSQFTTMDKTFVVSTLKMPDFIKKYQKDLDKESRGYLDQILSRAKESEKGAEEKPKEAPASNGTKETPSVVKRPPVVMARDLASASKKPVSDAKKALTTGASSLEARKVTNGTNKSVSGSPSKRPRDDEADTRANKKVALTGSSTAKGAIAPSAKTTTIVQPRPKTGGSILPGRSRPASKPAAKKPDPPQSSGLLSGLLAEIEKPKSPPKPKDEPNKAPETPEEKARRLRKEARRGLRVTWKPDQELEQVRLFQHEADEDEGRASNMIRDARDNRSEGQALKQALRSESREDGSQKDEEDEEEDDTPTGKPKEVALRQWPEVQATGFSHVDQVNPSQREKCYITRGGKKEFQTDEQVFMEGYEKTQLMEIYPSVSDIPETPKSPSRKETEKPTVAPKAVYLAADTKGLEEIQQRAADVKQFGPTAALDRWVQRQRTRTVDPARIAQLDAILAKKTASFQRHSARQQPMPHTTAHSSMAHIARPAAPRRPMSQAESDVEVLRLLTSDGIKNWVDSNPVDPLNMKTQRRSDYGDPKVQADIDALEDAAASFIGKPFPATEPPEHMRSNPNHVKEWEAGYKKDMEAAKAARDATESARALVAGLSGVALAAGQPAAQQPQPQDTNAAAMAAIQYYTQMAQAQVQAQPQTQQSPADMAAYIQYYQQYAAYQQAQQAQQAQLNAIAQAAQYQQQQPQPVVQDTHQQIAGLLAALGGQPAQAVPAATAASQSASLDAIRTIMQQTQNQAQSQASGQYQPSQQQPQQPQQQPPPQPQQPQQSSAHQHRDKDRDRGSRTAFGGDGGLDYGPSEHETREKGHRGRKENKENSRKEHNRKGINHSLIGTKPCTFWAQGKCAKGDQCTFRHDPNDLK